MRAKTTELDRVNEQTQTQSQTRRVRGGRILLHIILIVASSLMVAPFLWMVLSSFKTFAEIVSVPPTLIPSQFIWENFTNSLQAMPFGRAYFNSFYISILVVGTQMITASMAAYAFAKLSFPGREALFLLFLSTMMVPMQVTLIPLYLIMEWLGWLNTHLSVIVPNAIFNAFGVFLLRQFIRGIPDDVEEAAVIDGANPMRIYWHVILPLVRPALAAFGIFAFIQIYNNFIQPLVFLSSPELYTVPLLLNYFKGLYAADWALLMAGTTISVVPVLLVYVFAQRQIIEGIALTGSKG
ncbi:carbohydrate ABC transporter permease [Aureibacillus halotolerans]|uniref:Carbohydrate ABC transporter membrane protein 2 (CUT1 family) n=1 Tax=Aureibacillus halotolerans TaxID=1508390 RepID=A0A4R6TYF1_9BACI|nr:carbohydrate ABC transporter permease [Aureibacillus halotolerans]TDQ36955.1 carbohydrate ABC transporter membrane protein 2 (CUT1 family) [Aureibacillus halotolerans]